MGCESGMRLGKNGCYDDCYSAKSARLYGYDFSKIVLRDFENIKHLRQIAREINNIKMPFIRMGSSGDPSENWEHTINICKKLTPLLNQNQIDIFGNKKTEKEIVIITKHWNILTNRQLVELSKMNICVNTSVSAIDGDDALQHRLNEYERLKPYCNSVLRIVSFDFNINNKDGLEFKSIQDSLFSKYEMLDTVFRASKSNKLVRDKIISIHKTKFLGKNALISKANKKTYFGKCSTCLEMCGLNMKK